MLPFYRFTLRQTCPKPAGGYLLSLFDFRQTQNEREDEGFSTNSTGFSCAIRALVSAENWKLAESLKLGLR
ncbi:MAG: hypothetical protein ABS69_13280 [Nitrosomonadales bacterium SCN 54-20]|nr:MAG: hypothetical protein ABS69_13280 [Nitrosomonadales bacterium SCN 54-20]